MLTKEERMPKEPFEVVKPVKTYTIDNLPNKRMVFKIVAVGLVKKIKTAINIIFILLKKIHYIVPYRYGLI